MSFGKIIKIDLTNRVVSTEQLADTLTSKWLGGKGLAGHFLKPHISKNCNDPAMPLIFMTGPLVGTPTPTSGRMTVMSRSPLTGTVGDTSVGGSLGHQLRRAGIDGMIITGQSDKVCGIEIVDDSISFVDADQYTQMDTGAIYTALKPKGAVATIGPAAENGVLFSSIMVDGAYAAGRNGLGCIFANKRLKYITVKGTGKVAIHDREALRTAREDISRLIASSPILMGEYGLTNYGTGALYDLTNSRRMMPTANFSKTHFQAPSAMNAVAYRNRFATKSIGCRGCHIQCKKIGSNNTHIPEYETMAHFSALWKNTDIETVVAANTFCNEQGMDTISVGGVLSCYSEITGNKLTPAHIMDLLKAIANGQDIGKELGQGSYRYAESNGHPELSISVKKQELPAYDPRGAYGMALAYTTSTRGGCHLRAYPISHEILRKPVATDRFSFAGKARIIKISEDLNATIDSLTACKFAFFAASLEEYGNAYTAITGIETTAQDLLAAGERIDYNERIMNASNGFSAKDDDLPPRFFNEPGSSGNGIDVQPINRNDFLQARANYYKIRGLTPEGLPTTEKASELGLEL